jgi:hypothetical protein
MFGAWKKSLDCCLDIGAYPPTIFQNTMKLKSHVKVAPLLVISVVCALLLVMAVDFILNSGSGNTVFTFTPKQWRLLFGEEWIMMNTNGQKIGTEKKSQIGPFHFDHYQSKEYSYSVTNQPKGSN